MQAKHDYIGFSHCTECAKIAYNELEVELTKLRADHAHMVARNKVLRDRLDVPAEQLKPRLAILEENDKLREAAKEALDASHLRTHGFPEGDISDLDFSKMLTVMMKLDKLINPT